MTINGVPKTDSAQSGRNLHLEDISSQLAEDCAPPPTSMTDHFATRAWALWPAFQALLFILPPETPPHAQFLLMNFQTPSSPEESESWNRVLIDSASSSLRAPARSTNEERHNVGQGREFWWWTSQESAKQPCSGRHVHHSWQLPNHSSTVPVIWSLLFRIKAAASAGPTAAQRGLSGLRKCFWASHV